MMSTTQTAGSLRDALYRARGVLAEVGFREDSHRVTGTLLAEIDRALAALDPTVPKTFPTPARGSVVHGDGSALGLAAIDGRFGAVMASLQDGVALVDEAGRVVEFNPAAERICACAREAALGRTLSDVVAASALRAACALELARRRESSSDGGGGPIECVARYADGHELRVELAVTRVRGPGPALYTVLLRDVTQRRRAERELARLLVREQAARAQVESAEALVAFRYRVTRALFSYPLEAEARLGGLARLSVPFLADWCCVDLVDNRGGTRRVAVVHRDESRTDEASAVAAVGTAGPLSPCVRTVIERGEALVLATLDGAAQDWLAGNSPAREPARALGLSGVIAVPLRTRERIVGVLTFVAASPARSYGPDDLALAEELGRLGGVALDHAQMYEASRAAVQAREDILAVVSHDLKTPLTAVQLQAEVLLRDLPKEASKARAAATSIRRSSHQMSRLVLDLLDYASIEAGHLALKRGPCDVGGLVDEAIALLGPMALERGLRLEHVAESVDGMRVHCDRERVLQVLANLVGNAVKFSPAGQVITLRAELSRDGREVRFAVADRGPGIAADVLPRVFDRFWSASPATRQSSGLGLFIVRGLVEAHGGRAGVESTPGAGSTFWFTLPALGLEPRTVPPPPTTSGPVTFTDLVRSDLVAGDLVRSDLVAGDLDAPAVRPLSPG